MPAPKDCELYLVNRDALFSYHGLSELLLQRIWALYTSAHYKNSPNDLQMLSDAPAHRMYVLLGPQRAPPASSSSSASSKLFIPDILCVVQVAFEGLISRASVQAEMMRGNKASGDLIPWTIAQQYSDAEFASLSGARIVRIATHPDVQKMGYGSRAIELLTQYFQGELSFGYEASGLSSADKGLKDKTSKKNKGNSEGPLVGALAQEDGIHSTTVVGSSSSSSSLVQEQLKPRTSLPPLMTRLTDRTPSQVERLHWLGVSFGLTSQLLNFWSRYSYCY